MLKRFHVDIWNQENKSKQNIHDLFFLKSLLFKALGSSFKNILYSHTQLWGITSMFDSNLYFIVTVLCVRGDYSFLILNNTVDLLKYYTEIRHAVEQMKKKKNFESLGPFCLFITMETKYCFGVETTRD